MTTQESQAVFPSEFVWGAATSAYQIEGAFDQDGRGRSIWDTFAHTAGTTYRGDTGDVACDHYNRLDEDLDLIAELGLSSYRFSVAWSRVQPDGVAVNQKGLDFYERLVDGLLERDVSPALTLYHWDLPESLEQLGGWQSRDTTERFAEYAAIVAHRLGDRVPIWMTINEPWVAAWVGYGMGVHAPGIKDLTAAATAHHHLLLAHGRAVSVLREILPDPAMVGLALSLMTVRPASDDPADVAAAAIVDAQFNLSCADAVFKGEYPANLDGFSDVWNDPHGPCHPGDMELISTPIDMLGVNSYHARTVAAPRRLEIHRASGLVGTYNESFAFGMDCVDVVPFDAPKTATGWPINPDGMTELLMRLHHRYGVPLYVTENGIALHDYAAPDGTVDDRERVGYLTDYLLAVRDAMRQGADVRGYYVWSLLDNFEWSGGYAPRFGLIYVDYPTGERIPKSSFEFYREVIAGYSIASERADLAVALPAPPTRRPEGERK